MTSLTEKVHPGEFLLTEFDGTLSRDSATLITGQNLNAGTVLGKITLGTLTSAVKASGANTGNGTCVPDVTTPLLANAEAGVYQVRCIAASANAATFRLSDPKGRDLGVDQLFSGSGASLTFANQIKFAITDGGTDFVVGDGFDLTVAAGSGKFTILAPAALDGSQYAAAILYAAVDASAADQPCVIVDRDAEVIGDSLTWPGGISGPQKATATTQLAALHIVIR